MAALCREDRLSLACLLVLGCSVVRGPAALADDAEAGRELYVETCSKCHGLIVEDKVSWRPETLMVPTVTMPLGPPLSGVYLRPAGIMEGYAYSKALRAMATGWVWDEDALDGWLTSSQEFIRGSTMFLKVGQPARGEIIAYLKRYAEYQAE